MWNRKHFLFKKISGPEKLSIKMLILRLSCSIDTKTQSLTATCNTWHVGSLSEKFFPDSLGVIMYYWWNRLLCIILLLSCLCSVWCVCLWGERVEFEHPRTDYFLLWNNLLFMILFLRLSLFNLWIALII